LSNIDAQCRARRIRVVRAGARKKPTAPKPSARPDQVDLCRWTSFAQPVAASFSLGRISFTAQKQGIQTPPPLRDPQLVFLVLSILKG
jgi:hypothetical protein